MEWRGGEEVWLIGLELGRVRGCNDPAEIGRRDACKMKMEAANIQHERHE